MITNILSTTVNAYSMFLFLNQKEADMDLSWATYPTFGCDIQGNASVQTISPSNRGNFVTI